MALTLASIGFICSLAGAAGALYCTWRLWRLWPQARWLIGLTGAAWLALATAVWGLYFKGSL